jgi:hypothetical protein
MTNLGAAILEARTAHAAALAGHLPTVRLRRRRTRGRTGPVSIRSERQLDRDEKSDRYSVSRARLEAPLAGRLEGLLIQPVLRVEGADYARLTY